MKAALLLRVSTDEQDLDSQRNDLIPIAESFGYNVPEEFIFGQHITGRDDIRKGERESITRLKKACKADNIKAIFIYEVSRLSRSSIDGRAFVRDFNEMKIPIYFRDRGIWTLDRNTLEEDSTTKMIVGLFFDFAEQELKTIKSRTIRGRRNAASKGLATGGYLNYGYKKDKETDKVVIDETEAPFIIEMFTKYATGEYSLASLTKYANTLSYPTRYKKNSEKGYFITSSGYTKSTENLKWNVSVIKCMLNNTIYIGETNFQEIKKEVPAIIDKETFNKVQEKISSNPRFKEKSRNFIHLLQKKVFCGHCGYLMYGHIQTNGKDGSYLCSSYSGSKINCGNTTLNYQKFEAIIWDFIKKNSYVFNNLDEDEKADKIAKLEEDKTSLFQNIKLKETFIKQEKQKVSNLLELVKNSGSAFNMSDIIKDKTEIDKSIVDYEKEISKLNSNISLLDNRINQIKNSDFSEETITNIESDRNQMKKVINEVVDTITVYKIDNNSVVIQLAMYDYPLYNILIKHRSKRIFKYWYCEDFVATFLRGKNKFHIPLVEDDSNSFYFGNPTDLNETTYWEHYLFDELCDILEHNGMYTEYLPAKEFINPKSKKPDIIPEDEDEFRNYMVSKYNTSFEL